MRWRITARFDGGMTEQISFATFRGGPAENYERYFVPAIGAPLAAELVRRAAPSPGERVLDVACGTGVVARLAAARVAPTGAVTGVDLTPGMLAVARAGGATDVPVDWLEGNAERLPVSDESYDLALCSLGLQFVGDRPAALAQIRRVLVPGGRVALNAPGPMPPVFAVLRDALARHVGNQAAGFVGVVFSLHDAGEIRRDLSDAGFRHVEVTDVTTTLRLPAPGEFVWQYLHSTPLAAAVAKLDEDTRAVLERDVVAGWQPMTVDGRLLLELGIATATARR
jgi:ubiquinone/menaquinone biosynthesis C-methylase UbiE